MKKIFLKFCVPLMLINYNIYVFFSGILLSLSTGIFTTLCLEKNSFQTVWHLYLSVILYFVSGALCIYISTKISSYQNYISTNSIIDSDEKKEIIIDFENNKKTEWIIMFVSLLLSLILGSVLLVLNYYL